MATCARNVHDAERGSIDAKWKIFRRINTQVPGQAGYAKNLVQGPESLSGRKIYTSVPYRRLGSGSVIERD
jgi:hypothetical protein